MTNLSDSVLRKFTDSIEVDDWEIETESGWVDVTHINQTVQYKVWKIETLNCTLKCADTHILFRDSGEQVFACDLKPNDRIKGQHGIEIVLSVTETDEIDNMYDLTVTGNHTYYANGLLHHNTTVAAAYFVWIVTFLEEKTCVILANKEKISKEILHRAKIMYENLPKWIQVGVSSWNKQSIELENGSRILSGATASTGYRGFSIYALMADEFAFVPPNIADEFYTAMYPTLSSGKDTKFIITSTPNGLNHFYKLYNDAENGNSIFKAKKYLWNRHPDRDQKWADEQKLALGELKYSQEIACEFLGSSMTLLTGETLSRLTYDNHAYPHETYKKELAVYQEPIAGHKYIMTVDTSRGRFLDNSAFLVIDVTSYPHRIACSFYDNSIKPLVYASLIDVVGRYYNQAYVLVEINDIGSQVAETLWFEHGYENMFWTKAGEKLNESAGDLDYPGIRTTKRNKSIGCSNLKSLVEANQFIVNDFNLISELSTFIQKKNGTWAADIGKHDDLVMCGVLYAWMTTQEFFKVEYENDARLAAHGNDIQESQNSLISPMFTDGTELIKERSKGPILVPSIGEYMGFEDNNIVPEHLKWMLESTIR